MDSVTSEGLKKLAVRTTPREDVPPIQQKGKSVDGAEGWLNHEAALRTATSRPCGTTVPQRREVAAPLISVPYCDAESEHDACPGSHRHPKIRYQ